MGAKLKLGSDMGRAALILSCLVAINVHAAAPHPWWISAGAGVGEVEVVGHDRGELVSEALAQANLPAQVIDSGEADGTDTLVIGGGYRFSPYWGVGLEYQDLGTTEGSFQAQSTDNGGQATDISGDLESDYRALSAAVTGSWPALPWLAVQGKLGLHYWQHEFRLRSTQGTPVDERISDSGVGPLIGAGIELSPLPWLGLDLFWERFQGIEGEPGIDVKSIRVVFRFP